MDKTLARAVSAIALTFIGAAFAAAQESPRDEKKKDPLAHKIQQLEGGSVAVFDDWRIVRVPAPQNWAIFDTAPNGREREFVLRATFVTPQAEELQNMFVTGPQLVQQMLAGWRRSGEAKKCTFGGDEALTEDYEGQAMGKKMLARAVYIRKRDVAVGVLGLGTEAGFRELGRSVEIVAQSITLKESPLEPGLAGSWSFEQSSSVRNPGDFITVSARHVISIFPNGTFAESGNTGVVGSGKLGSVTGLAEGGSRGKIVKRGKVLTFHYDDGRAQSYEYELLNGGLKLNGKLFLRE